MLNKLKILLLMAAAFFTFGSCSNDDDTELTFIGDSHIARWDLAYCFPALQTANKGLSGSGIEQIERYSGQMTGNDVVVIIGINDLGKFSLEEEDAYVTRYVDALKSLQARKIYLFSMFPKSADWCYNELDDNNAVRRINGKIKAAVTGLPVVYIDVYDLLLEDGYLNMQYSYDGLHLSAEGYELITKKLKQVL